MVNRLKAYESYEKAHAEEVDQGRLILMMYAGAIQSLKKAEQLHLKEQRVECNEELSQVKMIILELLGSVNLDAGELAHNLCRIYISLFRNLNKFFVTQDTDTITISRRILEDLEGAWEGVFASDEYRKIVSKVKAI